MFSYVSAEQRVPPDHPLRAIRHLVDEVRRDMSRFVGMDMDEPILWRTITSRSTGH